MKRFAEVKMWIPLLFHEHHTGLLKRALVVPYQLDSVCRCLALLTSLCRGDGRMYAEVYCVRASKVRQTHLQNAQLDKKFQPGMLTLDSKVP